MRIDDLKVYEVSLDDVEGLTAISLVSHPAINENFVYMSTARPQMVFQTDEYKREIKGPVLIPNQMIYRSGDGRRDPYFIHWTEKSIYDVFLYVKEGNKRKVTVEHKPHPYEDVVKMRDFYISKGDEGFPKGTLMARYKVLDEKIWQRVTNGDLVGFSIEANVKLVPEKENKFI